MEMLFGPLREVQELVPEPAYEHQDIGTYPYTGRCVPPGGMEHQSCSYSHAELDT